MRRFVAKFAPMLVVMIAVAACGPQFMTRPANVDAGGFDCVSATLQRLGYMITDGDRSLGFLRAERTNGWLRDTDVLVVNYIAAGTVDDVAEDTIQVRASDPSGENPSYNGAEDAEHLLERCGET